MSIDISASSTHTSTLLTSNLSSRSSTHISYFATLIFALKSLIPLLLLHTAPANSNSPCHQNINRWLLSSSSREDYDLNAFDQKDNLGVNPLHYLSFNYNFEWLIWLVFYLASLFTLEAREGLCLCLLEAWPVFT
jgi:hypothetical protein